ncbi:MAG: hypothetical protein KKB31_07960 [Nanoarchaeota archaeon]|nr:hypothetical protein [Nanoarchaeota archaeon]
MNKIRSYPDVNAVGHRNIPNLFDGEVVIEEKLDGSQFSFGMIDGSLLIRSKGQQINIDAPNNMFTPAIDAVKTAQDKLYPEWVYRGEYLRSRRHNKLTYRRTPANHVAVFDVEIGNDQLLTPDKKKAEAERIGFECVRCFYTGKVDDINYLKALMHKESVLGGTEVEGVVVKNYNQFTPDGKFVIGKFVADRFKEKMQVKDKTDFLSALGESLRTEARWDKALQHLRDSGILEGTPKDIGAIVREVQADILKEEGDELRERIWDHYWKQLQKQVVLGLAEWYKMQLAEGVFSDG